MINKIHSLALLGFFAQTITSIQAQSTVASTTTTTTSTSNANGTISQFGPDAISLRTTTSTDPISYSSTKTTTYVDENGNPVSMETVKSGLPVTVYYDTDGTKMTATRVVVKKTTSTDPLSPMTSETTSVTSDGTVSQFSPDAIVVKTTSSADPVSYSYSKTTTYVDENGNPVSMETVKSGLPVTVYYDKDGTKMVATKVIVRKTTTTTTPNP